MLANKCQSTFVGQQLLANIHVTHDNIFGPQLNMAEMVDSADDDLAAAAICLNGISENVGARNLFGCVHG